MKISASEKRKTCSKVAKSSLYVPFIPNFSLNCKIKALLNLPELKHFPPEFAIVTHLLYLGAKACAQSTKQRSPNLMMNQLHWRSQMHDACCFGLGWHNLGGIYFGRIRQHLFRLIGAFKLMMQTNTSSCMV